MLSCLGNALLAWMNKASQLAALLQAEDSFGLFLFYLPLSLQVLRSCVCLFLQQSDTGEEVLRMCVAVRKKLQLYFWKDREFHELQVSCVASVVYHVSSGSVVALYCFFSPYCLETLLTFRALTLLLHWFNSAATHQWKYLVEIIICCNTVP